MRLERLALKHFRTHRTPLSIEGLGPGLTVVAGNNEEGKSTLLLALQAAFFLSAGVTGGARERLVPYGTNETPEVEVAFSRKGRRYTLFKRFQRGAVRLEGPDGTLNGDAAEAALEKVLGFERAKRVTGEGARPENMGLQALFWLEQGRTFEGFAPAADASRRLSGFMEGEIGAVAAGDAAAALSERVTRRRDAYFTKVKGDATGALREANNEVMRLESEVAELGEQRRGFEGQLDALRAKRGALRRLIEADVAGRARQDVRDLEAKAAGVEALEVERRLAEAAAAAAGGALAALRREHDARRALAETIRGLAAGAGRAGGAADEALALALAARALTARTAAAVAAARAARIEADARRRAGTAAAERRRCRARASTLGEAEAAIAAAEGRARTAAAAAAAMPVTPDAIAHLRRLAAERLGTEAALDAAATSLDFDLTGLDLAADGAPLDPKGGLRVERPTRLDLGPHGTIDVAPGGSDLAARRRTFDAAAAALDEALGRLGLASIEAAEPALRRREALQAEAGAAAAEAAARLAAHGARDLDALRRARAEAQARLAALPEGEASDAPDGDDLEAALARADTDLARAEADAGAALDDQEAAAAAHAAARSDAEVARSRLRDAEIRLDALRAESDDDALAADLAAAAATAEKAASGLAAAEARLASAEPDLTNERLRMAERRVEQAEIERASLERSIDALEVEVRTLGGKGIDVTLAEAHGRPRSRPPPARSPRRSKPRRGASSTTRSRRPRPAAAPRSWRRSAATSCPTLPACSPRPSPSSTATRSSSPACFAAAPRNRSPT